MSAAMFTDKNTPPESKIPVPASPTPLRRSGTPCRSDRMGPAGKLRRGHSVMERSPRGVPPRVPRSKNGGDDDKDSAGRTRSLSLSLSTSKLHSPKSPCIPTVSPNKPVSPDSRNFSTGHLDYWDNESVTSLGSSVASCDHATIARNGTTFSGKSMKYVFHCNQHSGATGDEYLTPTQRAYRQVKKLKYLLHQAKKDLEQKDSDILKLTKEVVELRLYKAALNSPEDKSQSNSSDAITVKENNSDQTTPDKDDFVDSSKFVSDLNNSLADSGNFEDGTNSSVHSKDSILFEERSPFKINKKVTETVEIGVGVSFEISSPSVERNLLIVEYERKIQELIKAHEDETHQLKQKQNDKVEELLQRITEINSRYWELVPELDTAKERIRELESKLEDASKKLEEVEDKAKQTYLEMYAQGQQAARLEHENSVMEIARKSPSMVSVPELLQELQVTKNELENIKDVEYAAASNNSPFLSAKEALSLWVLGARKAMYRQLMEAKSKNKIDPEVTLQFLKSAFYYFLTDKENSQGHLKAIQSILGFSASEISNIDKARLN